MATRTIYATIRIDLEKKDTDEITDEMVEDFVSNTLYNIPDAGEVTVMDTTWCGTEY